MHAVHEVDGLLDKFVHIGVILHKRDKLTIGGHKLLDERGGFERTAEFQGLSGIKQLNTKYFLHIVDNQVALGGGVGAHAHVVFLTL